MPKTKRPNPAAAIAASQTAALLLTQIGMPVVIVLDNGTKLPTVTSSLPWQLGHGAMVCKVVGKSGGYDCARILPRYESAKQRGLFYWAEPISIAGNSVPSWGVVSQADGFPATEAHDDWFAYQRDADEIAQRLAKE